VVSLPLTGQLPEKTRFRADGRTLLRAEPRKRGGRAAGAEAAEAIAAAGAVLVSDYGRGITADEFVRAALSRQAQRIPLVWDPHPKGAGPVPHTRLATPNYAEALAAVGQPAGPGRHLLQSAAAAAGQLSRSWEANAVGSRSVSTGLFWSRVVPARWSCRPNGWQSATPAGRATARLCRGGRTLPRRPHLRGGDRRDGGRIVLSRGGRSQALLVARQSRRGDPAAAGRRR